MSDKKNKKTGEKCGPVKGAVCKVFSPVCNVAWKVMEKCGAKREEVNKWQGVKIFFTIAVFAMSLTAVYSTSEEKLNEQIKSFILKNPQVLFDSVDSMNKRQKEDSMKEANEKLAKIRPQLENSKTSPSFGPSGSKETIVEFFDYSCGFCKRGYAVLEKVLAKKPGVRVIFKEFPILSPLSDSASRVALAVYMTDQSKYRPFHAALMKAPKIDEASIDATLKSIKLDPAKIREKSKSAEVSSEIEANRQIAGELRINGTPAFIINGKLYPGMLQEQDMLSALQ